MLKCCLFFLSMTCIFQSSFASFGLSNLDKILVKTTEFFEQLRVNYESRPVTPEVYKSIDKEVDEYVKKVRKSTASTRGKRQLDLDKEIGILNGLENVPGLDINDAIDVTFFVRGNGEQLRWYAATLNSMGITLLEYQDRSFTEVGSYDLQNGTRLISRATCEEVTLLVVQRSLGDTFVLRFSKDNGQQMIHKVQTLPTPDAIHSTLWRGMKKIYLAVISSQNLTIFTWLGENFDRIQTKNLGGKRLVPFQTGGSMHLIAIDEKQTYILKFLLSSSKFVVVQKIVGAQDGSAFHVEKGHLGEHFLALAGEKSTIIYKQTRHRFVPFQELPATQVIRSLTIDAAVLLILIENREIAIQQYDGWKFVESGIRQSGYLDALPVSLQGEKLLALKKENFGLTDNSGSKIWSFRRIKWRKRKSWNSLREETKIWCRNSLEKTLRIPAAVPELKTPIRVQKGHIENLRVREINGHNAKKFATLTERWNKIVSEIKKQEIAIKKYVSTVNPVFKNLSAVKVRVNCETRCHAAKIETTAEREFFQRLRRLDNVDQNLNFRKVKVSFARNLPCPVPAPKFQEATVTGFVNGISFPDFVEDVMKVTGDQQLNAPHTFTNLHVVNANIPLDVASNYTRQDIFGETVEVEELNITAGGLLVPLNGGFSVLSGSLTVPKVRVEGPFDLRAGISGSSAHVMKGMIDITEPLKITKNISLRNVKIVETLTVNDISRRTGKSFNEIMSNALPLNSDHVPIHFKFRDDKVSWKNLTLQKFPYKWITKNHGGHKVITGKKYATSATVVFGPSAFKNLPTPRLPLGLCSVNVTSEGIWDSNLIVDRATANSVRSINVFEESTLREFYSNAATLFDEILWDIKNFTGRVTVKKSNIGSIAGVDYRGLKNSMEKWVKPGHLKGSLKVANLQVANLKTTHGFIVSLPPEVGNVESQQNLRVDTLNSVDYIQFLNNVVKTQDAISLMNVTFSGGFDAEDVFATQTSFNRQENLTSGFLGSKEILGSLESEAMIVPHVLEFSPNSIPINIIANGNVRFGIEPKIVNVNEKNLEQLYKDVWLTDRPTIFSAEFIDFENVAFENQLTILKSFDTPNLGPWAGIENRLLSKSKAQNINVGASFGSIKAPNVIGAAKSRLRTNVDYLSDLENKALKKNSTQVITTSWKFDELTITGNFKVQGLVNGLNFATDIVRYDVQKNNITGKKIVKDLTARNIDGLKFEKFAKNALLRHNGNRTIVIKGWKTFETLEMQDISVQGKIMGRKPENLLLKSSRQNLQGNKIIQGSLKTPALVTNGTINRVNLSQLVKYQLKKNASVQIIKSSMMLANNLTILGNVTIDGLYNGVELRNFRSAESSFASAIEKTSEIMQFAEGIDIALANRAVYWDKLELLEENSTPLKPDPEKDEPLILDALGRCKVRGSSLFCNDHEIFDALSATSNGSRVLKFQILALSGIPLVASITSDPLGGVSIFRYILEEKRFVRVADLRIPGIVEGSITTMTDSLWISVGLKDHTMILRYELWSEFRQWILSGSGAFLMSSTPTEELLIFRSDGVWRLGGLAGPRNVYPVALNGQIDTFSFGSDYYVQLSDKNVTTLLKTRYVGN